MRKVSHEKIRNHIVKTHLVNQEYWGCDDSGEWYYKELKIENLYNVHSDYKGEITPVNKRYIDIYPNLENKPEGKIEGDVPEIVCRECDGRIYVIDGSTRVFLFIKEGRDKIGAFIHYE